MPGSSMSFHKFTWIVKFFELFFSVPSVRLMELARTHNHASKLICPGSAVWDQQGRRRRRRERGWHNNVLQMVIGCRRRRRVDPAPAKKVTTFQGAWICHTRWKAHLLRRLSTCTTSISSASSHDLLHLVVTMDCGGKYRFNEILRETYAICMMVIRFSLDLKWI